MSKSGETITGNIDLGTNKIMSSYLAQTENDLVNNNYVDSLPHTLTNLDSKLNKSGGTMTWDLNMGVTKISSCSIPSEDVDLVIYKYVDEHLTRRLTFSRPKAAPTGHYKKPIPVLCPVGADICL